MYCLCLFFHNPDALFDVWLMFICTCASPTYNPATLPWPVSKSDPAQITTSTNPTAPNVIHAAPRMHGKSTQNNVSPVAGPTPPEVEEPTLPEVEEPTPPEELAWIEPPLSLLQGPSQIQRCNDHPALPSYHHTYIPILHSALSRINHMHLYPTIMQSHGHANISAPQSSIQPWENPSRNTKSL